MRYLKFFTSFYFLKRGKPAEARRRFGPTRKQSDSKAHVRGKTYLDDQYFIDAFDARILMAEGRHEEAKVRLREALDSAAMSSGGNAAYVEHFCKFYLDLYSQGGNALAIKSAVDRLNHSTSMKRFLPFFSEAAIARIQQSGESH